MGTAMQDEANSRQMLDWIIRMGRKHGGTVWEKEPRRSWDWGEALCRERYGPDSSRWPDSPTRDDMDRAAQWETEDAWPDWAVRPNQDEEEKP